MCCFQLLENTWFTAAIFYSCISLQVVFEPRWTLPVFYKFCIYPIDLVTAHNFSCCLNSKIIYGLYSPANIHSMPFNVRAPVLASIWVAMSTMEGSFPIHRTQYVCCFRNVATTSLTIASVKTVSLPFPCGVHSFLFLCFLFFLYSFAILFFFLQY